MIEVLPIREMGKLQPLYTAAGLRLEEGCLAVQATAGAEVLGQCLFKIEGGKQTVLHLEPTDDILMADGILRAALHVGVGAGVTVATYAATAPEDLFRRLAFLTDTPGELNIEKLFQSCSCGK